MTRFRPCIDLRAGQVTQIVGGTLTDTKNTTTNTTTKNTTTTDDGVLTNHISPHSSAHFARLYRARGLVGGHVILLGAGGGNEEAARQALREWPGYLQVGGGVTPENAAGWIEEGAEKVIVTSYLFPNGHFSQPRLDAVLAALGHDRNKLVIDLSCRRQGDRWIAAMNKWQQLTDMEVCQETIKSLEPYCSEFLVHAADNEGLQQGIDEELVRRLGEWCSVPATYAGGARALADLDLVKRVSKGRVDLTIGSALDIFGGQAVTLEECTAWNTRNTDAMT